MKGQILLFNAEKGGGAIATADGQRFIFYIDEWMEVQAPARGMSVAFDVDRHYHAHRVQLDISDGPRARAAPTPPPCATPQPRKRKEVLTLWALFLGLVGAHRFYLGAWGWGLVQASTMLSIAAHSTALPHPLIALIFAAMTIFTGVEIIRYIWISDATFESKIQSYPGGQLRPFGFFW